MAPSRAELLSTLSTRVKLECAGGGLRRASRAISRLYGAAFAPLDLTATQFTLLVAINLGGPIPLSRLAEFLVLDRTSLYRAVKPLVRRRCVRILPGRTGRERTAALTDAGRQLLHEALPVWKKIQERFIEALGPAAWAALNSGLRQVVPTVQALESGSSRSNSSSTSLRAARR
jgi:DNA-binding MarR family transcriptional regulator